MSQKITCSLGSIDKAIKELEEYEKSLKEKVIKLVEALTEQGAVKARIFIAELGAVGFGELFGSIQAVMYREGNKGVIFTDCSYAAYVEFGTGIVGAISPHPTMPWAYDVNGHGEDGWHYYDERSGQWRWTKGKESRPFMYLAARELRDELVKFARGFFND